MRPCQKTAATPAGKNPTEAAKNRACQDDTGTARRSQGELSGKWKDAPGTLTDIEAFCLDHLAPFPALAAAVLAASSARPERVPTVPARLGAYLRVLGDPVGADAPGLESGADLVDLGWAESLLLHRLAMGGVPRDGGPEAARIAGECLLDYLDPPVLLRARKGQWGPRLVRPLRTIQAAAQGDPDAAKAVLRMDTRDVPGALAAVVEHVRTVPANALPGMVGDELMRALDNAGLVAAWCGGWRS
ncbi:MAG: hypothetical protein H3C30_13480 [Candidatus Hydrogenedentes bacterium]|nr:hypothetical protein [Candidatus Hydrogenedentota bacterium]